MLNRGDMFLEKMPVNGEILWICKVIQIYLCNVWEEFNKHDFQNYPLFKYESYNIWSHITLIFNLIS